MIKRLVNAGVTIYRPLESVLCTAPTASRPEIDAAYAANLDLCIVISITAHPSIPLNVADPVAVAAYQANIQTIYNRWTPKYLVDENELNNLAFWNGTLAQYLLQHAIFYAKAHALGAKVLDGALTAPAVYGLTINYMMQQGDAYMVAGNTALAKRYYDDVITCALTCAYANGYRGNSIASVRGLLKNFEVNLANAGTYYPGLLNIVDYANVHIYARHNTPLALSPAYSIIMPYIKQYLNSVLPGYNVCSNETGEETLEVEDIYYPVSGARDAGISPIVIWSNTSTLGQSLYESDGTPRPAYFALEGIVKGAI